MCLYDFRRDDISETKEMLEKMPKTKPGYYAVRKGRKPGIYLTWEECESQVKGFSDAKYQRFSLKTDAENFINDKKETVVLDKNKIQIWTDGCCLGNGTKEAKAGIAIESCENKKKSLKIFTDSLHVVNIIREWIEKWEKNSRIGSVKLTHVRGHQGNYGNEQADKLSKIGSFKDEIIEKDEKIKRMDHTWFRENENTNFRRPIMYPDDEGHITEYIQIKLNDKQNVLLNKERREFLKRHKFVLDKANIVEETTKEYLLELLYPEAKLANIKFKNGYSFDL
ncbi:33054_t:CDS:2, partial [Racocetra persica]